MENNKEKQTIIDNLTFGTAAAPFEMKCLDSCAIEIPRAFLFAKAYCTVLVNYLFFISLFTACLPIWTVVLRLKRKLKEKSDRRYVVYI